MLTAHVTGSTGDSGYIGDYPQAGTNSGAPYCELDSGHFLFWDGSQWNLSDSLSNGGSSCHFYAAGTAAAIPTTGWGVGPHGTGPAPTVTVTGLPSTTPPAPVIRVIQPSGSAVDRPSPDATWGGGLHLETSAPAGSGDTGIYIGTTGGPVMVAWPSPGYQPNTLYTFNWNALASGSYGGAAGPGTSISTPPDAVPILITPTSVNLPAPTSRPSIVTSRDAQLRAPDGTITTIAGVADNSSTLFDSLSNATEYQLRFKDTFPATGIGDGFSIGDWVSFTTGISGGGGGTGGGMMFGL